MRPIAVLAMVLVSGAALAQKAPPPRPYSFTVKLKGTPAVGGPVEIQLIDDQAARLTSGVTTFGIELVDSKNTKGPGKLLGMASAKAIKNGTLYGMMPRTLPSGTYKVRVNMQIAEGAPIVWTAPRVDLPASLSIQEGMDVTGPSGSPLVARIVRGALALAIPEGAEVFDAGKSLGTEKEIRAAVERRPIQFQTGIPIFSIGSTSNPANVSALIKKGGGGVSDTTLKKLATAVEKPVTAGDLAKQLGPGDKLPPAASAFLVAASSSPHDKKFLRLVVPMSKPSKGSSLAEVTSLAELLRLLSQGDTLQ